MLMLNAWLRLPVEQIHQRMQVLKRLRNWLTRTCFVPLRKFCLPAISLTRSPGGRHMEWAAAFFDPVLEQCERGVYLIGLVKKSLITIQHSIKYV